jgi:non-ribosomal peptide synthetase-like protein
MASQPQTSSTSSTPAPKVDVSAEVQTRPTFECLHDIFEYQASITPDAVAILDGKRSFTYGELEQYANCLAIQLQSEGVESGDLVGLYAGRSAEAIIGMLATLKSGAAYVPIDPVFPPDRIKHILAQSSIRTLLCSRALHDLAASHHDGNIIELQSFLKACSLPAKDPTKELPKPSARDLCYIIFTSGSTGRPKGVMTEHRNAVHFVESFRKTCNLSHKDRVLQAFSLGFDGSVEEIWMAFANGANLVIAPDEVPSIGSELAHLINSEHISFYSTVPTSLSMITEDLPSVRLLVVSGEPCPPELVSQWANTTRRMINVYGPTEATVNTSVAECNPGKPVTIGKALRGYELHVIGNDAQPVSHGMPGELYVGGEGVARGYLGESSLTQDAFVDLPNKASGKAERCYRTGDLVQWNEHQELLFLGRMDTQVKIRGYRIELAEIEAVLMRHPQIATAIVKIHDAEELKELAAYVTLNGPTKALDKTDLHGFLREHLPFYMVPRFLDILNTIPKLASGKADRKGLPQPTHTFAPACESHAAPTTATEVKLAKLWKQVFQLHSISVDDHFFTDLAGYSLLAAKMVSDLRNNLGYDVALREVYEFPSIRQLAAHIDALSDQKESASPCQDPPDQDHTPASVHHREQSLWQRWLCQSLQLLAIGGIYGLSALPTLAIVLLGNAVIEGSLHWKFASFAGFAFFIGLYPTMLLISIAAKWLIIGKYRAGRYPVWGSYYFRWWLVTRLQHLSGARFLEGSPLMTIYYRCMGAHVGTHSMIDTGLCFAFDLVRIGNHSNICNETQLTGYRVEDGELVIGSVTIGNDCFVGIHSYLGLGIQMADGCNLGDLSTLNDGETMAAGESRSGSPARPVEPMHDTSGIHAPADTEKSTAGLALGTVVAIYGIQCLLYISILPALFLLIWAYHSMSWQGQAATLILTGPLTFAGICALIALFKTLILKRIQPGHYPVASLIYLRKWTVDSLLRLSRGLILPLYTTLYFPHWLRMLGARIGRWAEISTVSQISPDLMELGEGSFFADGSIIGGRHFRRGHVFLSLSRVGYRSFIGNSAILPIGAHVGDRCLIGCLTQTPAQQATAHDSEWLGSPAFQIPYRKKVEGIDASLTYYPSRKLYAQRCLVDAFRIIFPSTLALGSLMFFAHMIQWLYQSSSLIVTTLATPVLALAAACLTTVSVAFLKSLLMGTFKPTIRPLWSMYVWLNEAVNGAYESLISPILTPMLGTPFAAPVLRMLGCRIGKNVFLETTLFSEFDLVRIDDHASINMGVVIQNHLFEDRIMKSSHLWVGKDCNIGNMSVILYDSEMSEGATIGPMSLLMKGETLPAQSHSRGIPTSRIP